MKKFLILVLVGCILSLVGCSTIKDSNHSDLNEEEAKYDLIPMVMIDGELYLDTGYEAITEKESEEIYGKIISEVEGNEKPAENDQSNFGKDFEYRYGSQDGTIEIYMNEKWRIFATEELRKEMQFPTDDTETIIFNNKVFNKSDLSEETIEWVEWYNGLPELEQLAVSSVPLELFELCGYPKVEILNTNVEIDGNIIEKKE